MLRERISFLHLLFDAIGDKGASSVFWLNVQHYCFINVSIQGAYHLDNAMLNDGFYFGPYTKRPGIGPSLKIWHAKNWCRKIIIIYNMTY